MHAPKFLLSYVIGYLLKLYVPSNIFWSVNFFRRILHTKSPVVNLGEPTWNTLAEQMSSNMQQSIVTDI